MKRAFTMIELVCVIVIISILANLGVPKLLATKNDAEAAKAIVQIRDIINEVTRYYTVHGNFKQTAGSQVVAFELSQYNWESTAAGEPFSRTFGEVVTGKAGANWTECIDVRLDNRSNVDPNIKILSKGSPKPFCKALYNTPAIKEWIKLSGDKIYGKGIIVGGSAIFK